MSMGESRFPNFKLLHSLLHVQKSPCKMLMFIMNFSIDPIIIRVSAVQIRPPLPVQVVEFHKHFSCFKIFTLCKFDSSSLSV